LLFKITPRKNGGVARRYYSEERLMESESLVPWGNLEEAFGFPVSWNYAQKLFDGKHPETGEFLTQRRKNRNSGWDMTFVAPKTVSILWGLSDDNQREKIEAAHKNAVLAGLRILSDHAIHVSTSATPFWKPSLLEPETEEKPLHGGFVFNHGMSRWRDPHLHTHAFLFNLGYLPERGKWRSIFLDFRWSYVAKGIYLLNLAWSLRCLGFKVKRTGKSFAVEGFSGVLKAFSSASEVFSMKEIKSSLAWKEIRKKKDLSKNFSRLRTYWYTRALVTGFDPAVLVPSSDNPLPESVDDTEILIATKAAKHLAHVWQHATWNNIGKTNESEVAKSVQTVVKKLKEQQKNHVMTLETTNV